MPGNIANKLAAVRQSRGLSAADLASQIGISRQTIHAIEAGSYVPNTEITLKLARILNVSVEDLFALQDETAVSLQVVEGELLSAGEPRVGQPVNTCRIGERLIAVPASASPYYLPESSGLVAKIRAKRSSFTLFPDSDSQTKLVWAGCDPAAALMTQSIEKSAGVQLLFAPASSRLALRWLKDGKTHIAGCHLRDDKTGEFNLPHLAREFPNDDFAVITFAHWEEGFVVLPGNPKKISSVESLVRKGVRLINREPGSGSRALLDRLLDASGLSSRGIRGYAREANGHLAAAYAVQAGEADCCLATRSAALAFGLDFLPLQQERYDLVMRRETLSTRPAQVVLNSLQRSSLHRKLERVAGYDTSKTGTVLA